MNRILAVTAAAVALTASPLSAQRRAAPNHAAPYWEASVGIAGGFVDTYAPGRGTLTSFTVPFLGSSGALINSGLVAPPSLFGLVPLGGRWAIEPSFDYHSLHIQNSGGLSTVLLGVRADYALSRMWYAAAGGQVSYYDGQGVSGETRTGALMALGARFHLAGALTGRVEVSYGFLGNSTNLPSQQNVAYLVGATLPLR